MNIVLLNQFYPPDNAPTGFYLQDLALALANNGHSVTVVTSRRSYNNRGSYKAKDNINGIRILRMPATGYGRASVIGRVTDYLSFLILTAVKLIILKPKPDIIIACTTPPYLGLLAHILARWREAQHIHWVMDLYPDALVSAKFIQFNSWMWSILVKIARLQWSGGKIIVLGPIMAHRMKRYARKGINWIPLWARSDSVRMPNPVIVSELRKMRGWKDDRLVIGYSGNIGAAHDINFLLTIIKHLGTDGPRWAFSGGGVRRGVIAEFISKNPFLPVDLLPFVPNENLAEHLASHDVHIVTVGSRWGGVLVPSKLQAVMAVGRPVLVIAPYNSEPYQWVRDANAGWTVAPNDILGMLSAISDAGDPVQRLHFGKSARQAADRWFNMRTNTAEMVKIINTPSRKIFPLEQK